MTRKNCWKKRYLDFTNHLAEILAVSWEDFSIHRNKKKTIPYNKSGPLLQIYALCLLLNIDTFSALLGILLALNIK